MSWRALELRDLDGCLRLLRGRLAYPRATLGQLRAFWASLLAAGALSAVVIEDRARDGSSPVAFAASVFVTNSYMREAKQGEAPYLTARTVALELGGRSPILRPPAIRRASAGDGLKVLLLHYGEDRARLGRERRIAVR